MKSKIEGKKPTPPQGIDIGNTLTLRFIGESIVYLADTIRLGYKPKYIIKNKHL